MKHTALQLYSAYQANSAIWWDYFNAEDEKSRHKAHEAATKKQSSISPELTKTIQADFAIRHPDNFRWNDGKVKSPTAIEHHETINRPAP